MIPSHPECFLHVSLRAYFYISVSVSFFFIGTKYSNVQALLLELLQTSLSKDSSSPATHSYTQLQDLLWKTNRAQACADVMQSNQLSGQLYAWNMSPRG